jgi:hypothetical protein
VGGEEGLDSSRQAGYDGSCQAGDYVVSMATCIASCAACQAKDPLSFNIPWFRSILLIRWLTHELDLLAKAPVPR